MPKIRVFKEFLDMVTRNSDRACYGPKNVETAHEMLAIETLLITDDLSGVLRLGRGISMLGWLSQRRSMEVRCLCFRQCICLVRSSQS